VFSNAAAFLLKFLTDVAQTPVSILGKIFNDYQECLPKII